MRRGGIAPRGSPSFKKAGREEESSGSTSRQMDGSPPPCPPSPPGVPPLRATPRTRVRVSMPHPEKNVLWQMREEWGEGEANTPTKGGPRSRSDPAPYILFKKKCTERGGRRGGKRGVGGPSCPALGQGRREGCEARGRPKKGGGVQDLKDRRDVSEAGSAAGRSHCLAASPYHSCPAPSKARRKG